MLSAISLETRRWFECFSLWDGWRRVKLGDWRTFGFLAGTSISEVAPAFGVSEGWVAMLHKVRALPEIENPGLDRERRIEASLWEVRNVDGNSADRIVSHPSSEGWGTRSRAARKGGSAPILSRAARRLALHVFHVRRDVPGVAERIFHGAVAIAVRLIRGFGDRRCPRCQGAAVDGVAIRNVHVEHGWHGRIFSPRLTGGLAHFHHRIAHANFRVVHDAVGRRVFRKLRRSKCALQETDHGLG